MFAGDPKHDWRGRSSLWKVSRSATRWSAARVGIDGIQPADVQELIDAGCRIVVLSQGFHGVLETCPETIELLETNGIAIHIARTQDAVDLYNDLVARGQLVGGLFHSTC